MRADMSDLLGELCERILQAEGVRKSRMMEGSMCENCGCELKKKQEARKAGNGKMLCEMLCEKCCAEKMEQQEQKEASALPVATEMAQLLSRMAKVGAFAEAEAEPKAKLGSGERYKALTKELADKGAEDPKALAAWIGRKKLGKEKFQKLAAAGKQRAS